MIALRRPRRLHERLSDALVFVAAAALPVAAAGYAVAVITAPEPEVRTVVHKVAPACREVAGVVQAERAIAAKLDEAAGVVLSEAEAFGDVVLTADPDAIAERAEALDDAKRTEQQLGLDLAAARTSTDATVGDCAPERPE